MFLWFEQSISSTLKTGKIIFITFKFRVSRLAGYLFPPFQFFIEKFSNDFNNYRNWAFEQTLDNLNKKLMYHNLLQLLEAEQNQILLKTANKQVISKNRY